MKLPIIIFMLIFTLAAFIIAHEDVHGTIDRYYGCKNISIHIGNLTSRAAAYTSQDCPFTDEEQTLSWLQVQSQNDIAFTSTMLPLWLIFSLILIIYINEVN